MWNLWGFLHQTIRKDASQPCLHTCRQLRSHISTVWPAQSWVRGLFSREHRQCQPNHKPTSLAGGQGGVGWVEEKKVTKSTIPRTVIGSPASLLPPTQLWHMSPKCCQHFKNTGHFYTWNTGPLASEPWDFPSRHRWPEKPQLPKICYCHPQLVKRWPAGWTWPTVMFSLACTLLDQFLEPIFNNLELSCIFLLKTSKPGPTMLCIPHSTWQEWSDSSHSNRALLSLMGLSSLPLLQTSLFPASDLKVPNFLCRQTIPCLYPHVKVFV